MVLHLEAGTCPSGHDSNRVDEVAFDCYQSRHYVADEDSDFEYRCRGCDAEFYYISGLLQHAESECLWRGSSPKSTPGQVPPLPTKPNLRETAGLYCERSSDCSQ